MALRKLDKLTEGQTVWTIMRGGSLYSIRVVEIDREQRRVLMSWNSNSPHWVGEKEVTKWKLVKPEPKGSRFGMPTY